MEPVTEVPSPKEKFRAFVSGEMMCLINESGTVGSPMRLTGSGLATLVWRGTDAAWVARGFEEPATPEQIAAAREFLEQMKTPPPPAVAAS